MKWLKGLLINLQFFTAIPVPARLPMDKEHLESSIRTFPLLGLLKGGIWASILYAFVEWTPFSPLAAAFALWLSAIILTGGIHLDGWIDASDAFFSYHDKDKRLEILKDPRTGAFGVLSVLVLLSAKFFFIYEIILLKQPGTYLLLVMIPFFSKMLMGVLLVTLKPAKNDGLGAFFRQASSGKTLSVYPVYLLLAAILAVSTQLILPAGILLSVTGLMLLYLRKKIISWFGGMTGDLLGASVEGTEAVLWLTLWLLHYFAMG